MFVYPTSLQWIFELDFSTSQVNMSIAILPMSSEFHCRFIYLSDLMRFLTEDQAVKTMSLLAGTPADEKVSKGALKTWVVRTNNFKLILYNFYKTLSSCSEN